MQLKPFETYKDYDIYKHKIKNGYVVYKDNSDPVSREAVRLFVQNDIDINMSLLSYKSTECFTKNDIDYDIILKRR